MTLRELYTAIEEIALAVPCVKTAIENDVLKLNTMPEVKYGVFAITPEQHTSTEGWINFTLNLFYIDRLVNSDDNEVEIQSHAIEVLRAIVLKIEESLAISETVRYTAFTRRFQDDCAGAWAVVTIQTPASDCTDIFNS